MTVTANFTLASYADGVLQMGLTPPAAIGGQEIEFILTKRFGGDPLIRLSCASGHNGTSGVTVVNSGIGVISISLFNSQVSGLEAGNYAYQIRRTESGYRTQVSEGYRMME